jgi:hypothetical protein
MCAVEGRPLSRLSDWAAGERVFVVNRTHGLSKDAIDKRLARQQSSLDYPVGLAVLQAQEQAKAEEAPAASPTEGTSQHYEQFGK